ncbi:RNA-directed DNA polymerase, eukaryota, reverse transcriptase zinc-binding domain protein [Tanacetum coccineum]|uniref:RNA-directed DNA polymerase, eukaryota, reverse transcriptase zinc-binding domain protein n=2 Tax=Tanacetum coccineum TaxID=301880 RepID=A0ABQ5FX06_9ASTR
MDFRSTSCVFLGYIPSHHGYRCLDSLRAMKEEYDALMKNGTWSLVPRASNTNVVDGCWEIQVKSVYEHELKGVSNSSSQNIAFLSTEVKGSTLKQSTADPANIPKGYTQALISQHIACEMCSHLCSNSDEIYRFLLCSKLYGYNHDDEDCCKYEDAMEKLTLNGSGYVTAKDKVVLRREKTGIDGIAIRNKSLKYLIKDCNLHERTFKQTQTHKPKGTQGSRDTRPVWNNIQRVNHSNFSGNSRYPHQRKSFIPSAVLTREGLKSTARPNLTRTVPSKSTANAFYQGTARPAVLSQSTGRPYYPRLDNIRPRTSSFSPSSRSSTTRTSYRPQRPKKIMKSIWVKKGSTVGSQAVLPQNVKESAMINSKQAWRPKGAYLDSVNRDNGSYTLKQFEYWPVCSQKHRVISKDYDLLLDSGCSGSMTGDKDKLSDFKAFKGGYVAFGNDSKGGKISRKGTIKTSCIDFEAKSAMWRSLNLLYIMFHETLLDVLLTILNYPMINWEGKVSTFDDVEDLDDQQFIVHGPSIHAAQPMHSEERTADKEVPLSSEEQALHDEISPLTPLHVRGSLETSISSRGLGPVCGEHSSQLKILQEVWLKGYLPTQSVARRCSRQGTAHTQGTAETQGTDDIPKSPNDYTPTDASQTSGGDEGLLDLYALNREVRRLKKQTLSQAKQIHKLKAKLKKLSKFVQPVVKHHAFWVESQNLKKRRKKQRKKHKKKVFFLILKDIVDKNAAVTPDFERKSDETEALERKSDETEQVAIEEEKDASNIKSGDTEELDLEEIQSPSSPIRPTQEEGSEEQFKVDEVLADISLNISRPRGLSIPGPIQSQPQQPTQATDPKDKGKGILVEEPKKKKLTLQQIRALETTNDEEVARKIQAEWDAEEERKRLEELKKAKPKTILKKPTSLAQERNQMMNFLKGQGYKNLQKLRYPQMKELYDKVQESIKDSFKDFIPMGSEKEKQLLQERDAKRLLRKRKATISEEQPSKKLKLRTETLDELRNYLRIVDFEQNAQDRESLEAISVITEFKVIDSPDGEYLIIFRANNHFRAFNTLWEILHILDRQDLYHLYRVVQDYYEHIPPTGLGLVLLGDLTTIWETPETSDDDFWKNQEDWEIIRWRLNESSGVHTLELEDGTTIHMLAERRYPLSRELMIRMLDHGMEVEDESETAITLIHLFILWTTEDANRLSKVIDKIVSKEQSAFIAGRQILDGPVILSEIIEWYKKRKKKLLIFKVDFEKAFDSISWNYLIHILDSFGFGNKWCSWIKACLNSSRASILINGSPTSEFSIKRGLRQGDPLSPFLFILVMEGLHNAFEEAVGNGLITGVNIKNSTINVSHLFYADDVIITTDWNAKDMDNIIRVLHVFYLASGLKINIHKSNIYGIGVNKDEVLSMASNAGCIAGDIPFNYLGLPIGSNMKSIASWKTLVDRFHMRLSSWKANLLSIGGRLTLIKSVLGSLGCGTRIRFWKDIWVGETPLFTRYNRLYHLDQDKDCLIIDRINNGQWSWNWSRTNLGVRNLAYLCDMLNEIGQLNIDVNEDTCTWSLGPNGTFTVKDARYRIDQNILPTLAHATTWDKSIPRKVNVFMWRLSLDRLPHRLNLSSRGMDIPAISCPSCNANVESANHVFFECDIATDMWKLVFRWCDIPLFQASSWDSFNDWIISWHASKEKKHRFYVITTSVLWWLWRYRNSVTFNSQPLRKSDLFDNVRFSSFSWLHNRDHMKLSWNDWLMYPLSITRNGNG